MSNEKESNKNYPLTDEEVTAIDNMLTGIAFKKKDLLKNYSVDDIVSELWVKTLEVINQHGRADMDLIASSCYKKIVDLVRLNIRHYSMPIDIKRLDYAGNEEEVLASGGDSENTIEFITRTPFEDPETSKDILIQDILGFFEKNSKEYKFCEIFLKISGVIESADVPDSSAFDKYAAAQLGYASSSSSGYTRLRNKVRKVLEENYKKERI
jgi:hypothetical protein